MVAPRSSRSALVAAVRGDFTAVVRCAVLYQAKPG
jgi:hypothetical protein